MQHIGNVLYLLDIRKEEREMAKYRECPFCHANLDPGERCECRDEEQRQESRIKLINHYIKEGKDGQLVLKERAS